MPFFLKQGELISSGAEVLVNETNALFSMHYPLCSLDFRQLGPEKQLQLRKECQAKAQQFPGWPVVTEGYGLSGRYIIHLVGTNWVKESRGNAAQLKKSYQQVLSLAKKLGCQSVAFPLLSANDIAFADGEVLEIARETIAEFLQDDELTVYMMLPSSQVVSLNEQLIKDLAGYIDRGGQTYDNVSVSLRFPDELWGSGPCSAPPVGAEREATAGRFFHFLTELVKKRETEAVPLNEVVEHLEPSFSQTLFQLIKKSGYSEVEVYKRANMDRRLFAKIRKDENYHPQKKTVLALALALQLTIEETQMFLQRAGYSLSGSQKGDAVFAYFIQHQIYDIYLLNEALFYFGEATL